MPSLLRICLFIAFFAPCLFARAAEPKKLPKVSFNRDIRPIMSDTCFHCHGFDAKTREAGLRLDIREEALKKTENDILPIVPGKPELSGIITRILDDEDPMPPEKAHKPFTAAQKELFRRWVAEGAEYEPHWAYAPLTKPAVPAGGNPIDAFVRAKLRERGIEPSVEASKSKLLRRLSLDLTGLPPTPSEVTAFMSRSSPDAYEKEVERLLASPHFGERMAVWWLDIARFADTVGFHGDQNQRIYPYRDYVIDAFNTNKRFDQFTLEQLAGDLLPNATSAQLVATGYNRLNMMTREGGAQTKEYLAKYGAERVRSVAAAWFGSTFGCAECHDHKFDPIKTRDFYELQSFFADVKQWGVYGDYKYTPEPELAGMNNDYPFPPEIEIESPYVVKRLKAAEAILKTHLEQWRASQTQLSSKSWETELAPFLAQHPEGWITPIATARLIQNGKPVPKSVVEITADADVKTKPAPGKGQSLEVTLPCAELATVSSLRIDVLQDPPTTEKPTDIQISLSLVRADGKKQVVSIASADARIKAPRYSGGVQAMGIEKGWTLPYKAVQGAVSGLYTLESPFRVRSGDKLIVTVTGSNSKPIRFSLSPLSALKPLETASKETLSALATPAEKRTVPQQTAVFETWFTAGAPDPAALKTAHTLARAVRDLNEGRTWTMVTQATQPLRVRVLPRGNWQSEAGDGVLPSTPSFLPARLESTEQKRLTRLDLAKWIVSKENPITARAVMNRLWQQFYGVGLSAVVDDLGSQGELPSHLDLLDWLASEFKDSGWEVKHMIRLIVTSQTYRQSSSLRPELKDIDPANRLLASQNPRRLDAEFIRDNALAIAGVLNVDDIGGPSAKPYQPADYYDALQFPSRDYIQTTDREQWRRGVYMHWQRTFLHPMLANFDAPARDECAALRTGSNTPQQALTLLNDPSFVEAARLLATRLLSDATSKEPTARLHLAYQIALARAPKPKEIDSLLSFLTQQQTHYTQNPSDAAKLIRIGLSPFPEVDPIQLATWTSLCRVILNSQEVITRY